MFFIIQKFLLITIAKIRTADLIHDLRWLLT